MLMKHGHQWKMLANCPRLVVLADQMATTGTCHALLVVIADDETATIGMCWMLVVIADGIPIIGTCWKIVHCWHGPC